MKRIFIILVSSMLLLSSCSYTEAPIEIIVPTVNIVSTTTTMTTITDITTVATTTATPIVTTEVICDDVATEVPILDNCLYIRDEVIHLSLTDACQQAVDDYDVVYPTGFVCKENTDEEYVAHDIYPNTVLFGHSYKSFAILNSLCVGETLKLTVNSSQTYEIQRSEEAYLNDLNTSVIFYSDDTDVLYHDYGYKALILLTCSENGRWVIVAEPI